MKKAFTHVLVPLDGSALAKQAIPYARYLAGATGRITLLRVVEESADLRLAAGLAAVPPNMIHDWIMSEARKLLNDVADELRQTPLVDVDVDTVVLYGDVSEIILQTAEKRRVDLIVMTSHARGTIGRAAFGSVADRVSRTSTIPVVITRPEDEPSGDGDGIIRRIIVPLDGSELAHEAIPVAKDIALRLGCPVRIIHVIDTVTFYLAATGMLVTQPMLDEWHEAARSMLEPTVTELRSAGIETSLDIYDGSPTQLLLTIAASGDLIVMTSHGRSGLTRWVLGSVAEKLVRSAPAPVCVVPARPPALTTSGQESPANLARTP